MASMRSGSTGDIDSISMQGDSGGKELWFQLGMERELGVHVPAAEHSMDSLRDMAYAIIETKVVISKNLFWVDLFSDSD